MLSIFSRSWVLYAVVGVLITATNGWTAWKVQTITTRHYERKMAVLEQEKKILTRAIEEVKRLEAELNNDLENARKEGDSIKPVTGSKPADRLRVITGYPGCRDCK